MGNDLKKHIDNAEKTGVCQLSSTNLSEFPSQLLRLVKNLRTLDLSHNKIQFLPEAIGNFALLKTLNLKNNRLGSLCQGACQLRKLETLQLDNNNLKSLPKEIDQLSSLKTVSLSNNQLKVFPVQFSKIKHLNSLDLSGNSIATIPNDLEKLQVVEINLNRNQINRLPDALVSWPRLKVLRFEENCVSKEGMSVKILTDSGVALLAYRGNLFSDKDFQNMQGYDQYMERFTATKKKFD